MYSIYHIRDVKIGCTSQLVYDRVSEQGYEAYEILETHDDIYIASKRENELQKQYGYRVDHTPYWLSVKNRKKFTPEEQEKGRDTMKKNGFYKKWYKAAIAVTKKPIVMLDKNTLEPIKEFDSVANAARYVDKPGQTTTICRAIKKHWTAYGYKWKYKD